MIPRCDRCQRVNVQVVPILGRDLCGQCCELFGSWVEAGQERAKTGLTVEIIQRAVCDYFSVTIDDLKSARRHRAVVFPRMVAMYLCRQRLGASFPDIGRAFGDRDHTTAVGAVRKIRSLIEADDHRVLEAIAAVYGRLEAA